MGELATLERDKLQTFWSKQGRSMFGTLRTPQFLRLQSRIVRNIDIRHLHNYFGWQAGADRSCVGAVYRTEAFMRLPDERRCGTKALGQTIHIEHTVPIATLVRQLSMFLPHEADEAIVWILARSVVTAVTGDIDGERYTMVQSGLSRSSHVFTAGHLDECLPFRRYNEMKHSAIWNVVTGCLVDTKTFSFADHRASMATVLRWAGLDSWARLLSTGDP